MSGSGKAIVTRTTFRGNKAYARFAGAMLMTQKSSARIAACAFDTNMAEHVCIGRRARHARQRKRLFHGHILYLAATLCRSFY